MVSLIIFQVEWKKSSFGSTQMFIDGYLKICVSPTTFTLLEGRIQILAKTPVAVMGALISTKVV